MISVLLILCSPKHNSIVSPTVIRVWIFLLGLREIRNAPICYHSLSVEDFQKHQTIKANISTFMVNHNSHEEGWPYPKNLLLLKWQCVWKDGWLALFLFLCLLIYITQIVILKWLLYSVITSVKFIWISQGKWSEKKERECF